MHGNKESKLKKITNSENPKAFMSTPYLQNISEKSDESLANIDSELNSLTLT